MINEDPIYELIEDFLQGNLSEQDEAKVKSRMNRDPLFEKEVEESAYLNHVIEGAGVDMLREKMTQDIQKIDQTIAIRKNILKGLAVLSIITGLIFSVFSLFQKEKVHVAPGQDSIKKEKTGKIIPKNIQNDSVISKDENESYMKEKSKTKKVLTASTGKKIVDSVYPENEINDLISASRDTTLKINLVENTSAVNLDKKEFLDTAQIETPAQKSEPDTENCVIDFETVIQPSCDNRNSGSINISVNGSGQESYKYILDHDENSTGIFTGLASKSYSLFIVDSKGCKSQKDVSVPEEPCYSETRSFSFAPHFGEEWEVIPQNGKTGVYTILNKSGQVIKNGTINNVYDKWDGTDLKGAIVSQGMYICLFNYSDGSVEKVEVTVIR